LHNIQEIVKIKRLSLDKNQLIRNVAPSFSPLRSENTVTSISYQRPRMFISLSSSVTLPSVATHRITAGYAKFFLPKNFTLFVLLQKKLRIIRGRCTQFKKHFSTMNIEIDFLKRMNLIFSFIIEGDNIVFSSLRYENDIFINFNL